MASVVRQKNYIFAKKTSSNFLTCFLIMKFIVMKLTNGGNKINKYLNKI